MDTWATALRAYHSAHPEEKFSIPKRGTDKYNAVSALRSGVAPEDNVYGGERVSRTKSVVPEETGELNLHTSKPKRKYTKKSTPVAQE